MFELERPNCILNQRNRSRNKTQRANAESDQSDCLQRIGCHFSAQLERHSGGFGSLNQLRDYAQHCRMKKLIEVCDVLIDSVNGKRVLNQVDGADDQAIRLASEA